MADPAGADTLGDALIPIVNKLQDIFSQVTVDLKLDLPQVAVVGSQSSGKSSVLEALVGRDFLPRGSEIVTRRPLVLQLVKTPAGPAGRPTEWGEFLHAPGRLFHDWDLVRSEIQAETERLVGVNKNVSDKPIRLKIFSPRVLTMTLIDLPGLTRIPVGDQPTNIESRIREMVLEYIRRPNCLILAVSPANVDLATSDALQLANEADPEGVRTIGVLTKLDIMDRGTDATHILRNQHIPLRLGYVGVVLRSQQDIKNNKPMSEARKSEDAFFASRPEYRDVLSLCGSAVLARHLNAILVDHIRGLLPGLRRHITRALEQRSAELQALGDPEPMQSKSARGAYLLQLLCEYAERFAAMLDGRHLDLSMSQQLSGGARVREVFTEQFGPALSRLDPARDMADSEVSTVIRNGAGVQGNLLVPQEPFELLVKRAIAQLLAPSLLCKERVFEELVKIAEQACPGEVGRFPYLQRQLATSVLDFIRSGAAPAESMIRSLVECEGDYINCDHPDFIGGRGAIRAVMQERSIRQAQRKDSGETSSPSLPRNKSTPTTADQARQNGHGGVGTSGSALGLKGLEPSSHSDEGAGPSGRGGGTGREDGGDGSPGWFTWFSKSHSDTAGRSIQDETPALLLQSSRNHVGGGRNQIKLSDSEQAEVEVVRKLVESYFVVVRRSLADQVPKAIMHFLVNHTKRGLQQHLIRSLYREELLDNLLTEAEDVVQRRTAAHAAVAVLKAAAATLEEVPTELMGSSATSAPSSSHAGAGSSDGSSRSTTGSAIMLGHIGPGTSFTSLSLGRDGDLRGESRVHMDRHPSMVAAARVAASAAAVLQPSSFAIGNGDQHN